MYQITCDEHILYDVRDDEYMLHNPVLHLNANSAGTLSFTIYDTHPHSNDLKKMRSVIRVNKDGRTIWKGRIVNDRKNFYGDRVIRCEGKLAFFNDSIMRAFEFNGTPAQFFRDAIENHNSQVKDFQKFKVGNVTVQDNNDYIVRSSETNLSTYEVLRSRMFESNLGGYLHIRYEADGDYIDWLKDFKRVSKQEIRLGENLLEMVQETDAEETYTAMIPQGFRKDSGDRLDISSVNGGKDYIVNEEMAHRFGTIYAPQKASIWEDVTEPENLLRKALDTLNNTGIKLKETIELKAFDLNMTDAEMESFNHCEYIPVTSEPHGINQLYLLKEMNIFIDEPQNTAIIMGESRRTLSDFDLGGSSGENGGNNDTLIQKVDEIEKLIPANMSDLNNDTDYQTKDEVVKLIEENIPSSEATSPTVAVKTDNEEEYVLTVTDVRGSFDTPNLKGKNGEAGKSGEPGKDGTAGKAATIELGTVTTGEPGSDVIIDNVGTENEAILNFVIPRGDKGEDGGGGSEGSLAAEDWVSVSAEVVICRKIGGCLVELSIREQYVYLNAGGWVACTFTIPEGYRPSNYIVGAASGYISGNTKNSTWLGVQIGTDGRIFFRNNSTSPRGAYVSAHLFYSI